METKHSVYETIYGNACEYTGGDTAWDLDMRKEIPVEMVDFSKFLRQCNE